MASGVCAASPDGRTLAFADDAGLLHVLDAATGADRRTIELRGMGFSQLAFSPDGQLLAAGGTSGDKLQIVIWKVALPAELLHRWDWPKGRDPHSDVECLSFTPDGKRLAAAVFRQGAAYLWDAATGERIAQMPHKHVYGLSFSPDGETLATAGWDSVIRFWEADTGKLRQELKVSIPNGPRADLRMYAVCFSPAGGLIATAHMDCTVRVWQVDTMKLRQTFDVHGSFLFNTIRFSPDGLWLASGTSTGECLLWDPLTGEQVAHAGTHQHYVYTVGFGRDSRVAIRRRGWHMLPLGLAAPWKSAGKGLAQLWTDLAGDSKPAYKAMWALAEAPKRAVPLLAEKARDWEKRAAANSKEGETLAARRTVSVLSQIGTPEAIRLLKKWAQQEPDSILGQPAAASTQALPASECACSRFPNKPTDVLDTKRFYPMRVTFAACLLCRSRSVLSDCALTWPAEIVCSGEAAGGYAAFPDICRLPGGDLFCVFYSGYGHVSTPRAQWPKGGRIMAVRSRDNGREWSKPAVVMDTDLDDRDPSVASLSDGTLLLNWFTLDKGRLAVWLARSADQGHSWSRPAELVVQSSYWFACSSPVRELPDHSLILGLYHEDPKKNLAFGATVKSYDGGKTWKDLATIGERSGVYLDAETDVVSA